MRLGVLVLLLGLLLGGSLRAEISSESVLNFADVAGRHFHALKVNREYGEPAPGLLTVYVEPIGDARNADLTDATTWLAENLGVSLVARDGGLPLYLTNRDLVGSQGNDALGATVPTGMVVEARAKSLLGCAVAHEVGHALGLKHNADRKDIMATRCDFGKLDWATASDGERDEIARLQRIDALTVTGRVVWAERL